MSSGAAEIVGQLLRIPVLREITVAVLWYLSLQYAVADGAWSLFFLATCFAAVVLGLSYFRHHRANKSGGGGKLLLVLLVIIVALPLLIIAWRQRKASEGTGG